MSAETSRPPPEPTLDRDDREPGVSGPVGRKTGEPAGAGDEVAEWVAEEREALERAVETLVTVLEERDLPALAAPVAGIDRRILVIRSPDEEEGDPWVLLDPVVESVAREREEETEECLCLPGFRVRVPRSRDLMVRARTRDGETVRFAAGGELARALQHQIDHLDGILLLDRLAKETRDGLPDSLLHPPSHCGGETPPVLEEERRS